MSLPSWLTRFLSWVLDPILSRPNDGLDRVLAITDAKIAGAFRRVEAAPDAAPRHRFRAAEVPMRELAFGRLRWPQIRRLLNVMPGLMQRMLRSGRYYRPELPTERTVASAELLARVETVARDHGALDVAYLDQVRPEEIFRDLALPAPGVIVFTVEMQPEPIAQAPGFEAFHEVASGYRRLAEIAEAICDLLQAEGHAAYPGTALGGQTDYVALARRAGMGGIGFHGLLLTPQAGARVRVATVYTNLTGLPERGEAEHDWVQDFCRSCRQCVRSCPPQAIHPEPRPRTDGIGTACIDHRLCRDYFAREFGCAVCIKVCPFSTAGYDTVRAGLAHAEPGLAAPVDDRPFRAAVVGAGAAGFYTTRALLARTSHARIDLVERLPMPHGLVRYGVAPDHPEVRSKAVSFDEALRDPRVRFFGNVAFGTDVTREELLDRYDAVVYATGAGQSRTLGVAGEELVGSVGAPAFVGWYNGHPDHASLAPPLDRPVAVIVGAGNVALDVARMLASPVERLLGTDMAQAALDAFGSSRVTELHILVRRGPEHAAFTPRELRDLAECPGVQVRVRPEELGSGSPSSDPRVERNLELLHTLAAQDDRDARIVVHVRFGATVAEIVGDGAGRVRACLVDTPEGQVTVACGLVVRAIGFRGTALGEVPFDDGRAVVPTLDGRVVDSEGRVQAREYASGWIRRGPRGIIGTNKVDAEEVVGRILDDLPAEPGAPREGVEETLRARGVRVVTASDWDRLRREEHLRGSRVGRVAIRRTDVPELLASLAEAAPLGGDA